MKFSKKLAFILIVIVLLSSLMIGCTPEKGEQLETQTLPVLDTLTETGKGQNSLQESQTQQASAPVQTGSDGQITPDPTDDPTSDPEDDGLEVESGYTVEIGGNLGVGGN